MPSRELVRLNRALRNQAEREAKANGVDVKTGRVASVDVGARVAQVRFDGQNSAASVRWKGGSAPAVGDTVDVLVKSGSMSILAGGSGSTSQVTTTVIQQVASDDFPLLVFLEGGGW